MARWRNITKLQNKDGNILVWGMAFTLLLTFIFLMFFEKYKLQITVDEIKTDITYTLTSTASNNLYKSYASVRDSTSGTYLYQDTVFTEIKDVSKFTQLFTTIYQDTTESGRTITKFRNGVPVFKLSDITLFVNNATGSTKRSTYICQYTLTVHLDLLWKDKVITLPNQKQIVSYINKY